MSSSPIRTVLLTVLAFALVQPASAASISVHPSTFTFTGSRQQLQLVVTKAPNTTRPIDVTTQAEFTSMNPSIATVSNGVVRPVGNGVTEVEVTSNRQKQTVKIKVTGMANAEPVSFDYHVLPVLAKAGCSAGSCHGSPHGKGSFRLSLRAFDRELDRVTLVREEMGRRTNPFDPSSSLLLAKPTMKVAHEGGKRLDKTTLSYQLLHDWIAEGCQINDSEPACIGIDVFPGSGRVIEEPNFHQQLSVHAVFDDGSRRDVTHLSVFTSSHPDVAVVTSQGLARGTGRGEVAIIVRYLQHVQSCYLTFVQDIPGFTWTNPPAENYVDKLVYDKLRQLKFLPAPPATDSEFIRRAFLDTIGLLPSKAETETFLSNNSETKRADLIDTLLARPEHARFWALKWGDLLRVSRKQIGTRNVFKYSRWLESALAANLPYDEFAQNLITASGSTHINPPANFYHTSGNAEDAMETAAQLFLGSRIQCAKCHNHPFERWTQDNYFGLTSIFSGVQRKKTSKKGEQFIWTKAKVETKHPRTGQPVDPWVPGDGTLDISQSPDARQAFAKWLTSPTNPFFARVEVNRIWSHIMGKGIVEPFDDFRDTNPPANAPLLDALAEDFVRSGYDRRHIIRTILKSNIYQASSHANDSNKDDHRYFSHYAARRLSAEQLIDALGQVTGAPKRFDLVPPDTKATQLPAPDLKPRPRNQIGNVEFLKVFGQPERQTVCECARGDESSLGQALQLYNGQLLHEMLTSKNNHFRKSLAEGKSNQKIVEEIYLAALCRKPSPKEISTALTHINQATDKEIALEDISWAILNKSEFLFQH